MSGDTLIVRGNAVNGPPPEKTINLAHVTAPRFGPKDQPDEVNFMRSLNLFSFLPLKVVNFYVKSWLES